MMVAYITAPRNMRPERDPVGAEKRSTMLTILIVDDQPQVLDALRQCFAMEPDITIVGKANDGLSAVTLARELHPDIVLTDIKMPHMDGLEVARTLHEIAPETRV